MLLTNYLLKNTKLAMLKWKEWRLKRNTVLDTLVYFNYHTLMHHACVIDPMHYLHLGTAKHCIDIWKSTAWAAVFRSFL